MNKHVEDILDQARRRCLENLSKQASGGAILEAALRTSDGNVAYDAEGLRTPLRKDIAKERGDSWVTMNVDSPTIRPSAPMVVIWKESLNVSIQVVTWDYMTFQVSPYLKEFDWMAIRHWFLKWFDAEDSNPRTSEGLSSVVHFISDPEIGGEQSKITVDFGSAPVVPFFELLDCLAEAGFKNCTIL